MQTQGRIRFPVWSLDLASLSSSTHHFMGSRTAASPCLWNCGCEARRIFLLVALLNLFAPTAFINGVPLSPGQFEQNQEDFRLPLVKSIGHRPKHYNN
eukprot:2426458-Amphidinium_carterae.1